MVGDENVRIGIFAFGESEFRRSRAFTGEARDALLAKRGGLLVLVEENDPGFAILIHGDFDGKAGLGFDDMPAIRPFLGVIVMFFMFFLIVVVIFGSERQRAGEEGEEGGGQ